MELIPSLNSYEARLLDKPSVVGEWCAVCGAPATNRHHVVFKGMGGRSKAIEGRIPLVSLCGMGNTGGCHGLVHSRKLFMDWRDGWVYLLCDEPTKIDDAMRADGWKPLPGWRMEYGR